MREYTALAAITTTTFAAAPRFTASASAVPQAAAPGVVGTCAVCGSLRRNPTETAPAAVDLYGTIDFCAENAIIVGMLEQALVDSCKGCSVVGEEPRHIHAPPPRPEPPTHPDEETSKWAAALAMEDMKLQETVQYRRVEANRAKGQANQRLMQAKATPAHGP